MYAKFDLNTFFLGGGRGVYFEKWIKCKNFIVYRQMIGFRTSFKLMVVLPEMCRFELWKIADIHWSEFLFFDKSYTNYFINMYKIQFHLYKYYNKNIMQKIEKLPMNIKLWNHSRRCNICTIFPSKCVEL